MPNDYKRSVLSEIERRCGQVRRLGESQSLIEARNGVRVYLRYSKVHGRGIAFYGLRLIDLNALDGHPSYLCLFTDRYPALMIPYADFELAIRQSTLAADGQYKIQLSYAADTKEVYIPKVGHFNVDAYGGLETLSADGDGSAAGPLPTLTHWQVQTLLGSIGASKGYEVYVPANNAGLLDRTLAPGLRVLGALPAHVGDKGRYISEIDVIWLNHGSNAVAAAFEVEHSTPIYSGLLRFNDALLTCHGVARYFIVSNDTRRDLFARQVQRPTFQRSGLSECVSFLDYNNVVDWHRRLCTLSVPDRG